MEKDEYMPFTIYRVLQGIESDRLVVLFMKRGSWEYSRVGC